MPVDHAIWPAPRPSRVHPVRRSSTLARLVLAALGIGFAAAIIFVLVLLLERR